jgi:membrane protein DedA with SNARE-associated domain
MASNKSWGYLLLLIGVAGGVGVLVNRDPDLLSFLTGIVLALLCIGGGSFIVFKKEKKE